MRGLAGVLAALGDTESGIRVLGGQIATARRSAPWSLLQRRNMRAAAALAPTRELAAGICLNLRFHVEETMYFAGHIDFVDDPQLRIAALDDMVGPLSSAIEGALTGDDYGAALESAEAVFQQFKASEHSRLSSMARRPLHRTLEDLRNFRLAAASGSNRSDR